MVFNRREQVVPGPREGGAPDVVAVRLLGKLDPGKNATAVLTINNPDSPAEFKDTTRNIEVYDSYDLIGTSSPRTGDEFGITFGLPGEIIHVFWSHALQRWNTIGTYGLRRIGKASEDIAKGQTGSFKLFHSPGSSSCTGSDSGSTLTVCAKHDVMEDDEYFIQYHPEFKKWFTVSGGATSSSIPLAEADINQETMCPNTSTVAIDNFDSLGYPIATEDIPTTAVNKLALAGYENDRLVLYYVPDNGQGQSEWRILNVIHKWVEIVEDVCLEDSSEDNSLCEVSPDDDGSSGDVKCNVVKKVRLHSVMHCTAQDPKVAFSGKARDNVVNVWDDGTCINQTVELQFVLCFGEEADEQIICTTECTSPTQ